MNKRDELIDNVRWILDGVKEEPSRLMHEALEMAVQHLIAYDNVHEVGR